jgi:hypothetical protein
MIDGFVKSSTSALRFVSLSLRRTLGTPHDTKLTRLEFEAFYFAIVFLFFWEIPNDYLADTRNMARS